jgi:GNAT superfamily N-acetyltransferase
MTDVRYQPAKPSDAPAIAQLARESWHAAYDDFLGRETVDEVIDEWYNLDRLRDAAENDTHVFVVAVENGDIHGFAHAAPHPERGVWILIRIYVTPDRWGDGIGTALLGRVERELEDRGVSTYELAVLAENEVGVSFYESRGFERSETRETELADVKTTEHWYLKEI